MEVYRKNTTIVECCTAAALLVTPFNADACFSPDTSYGLCQDTVLPSLLESDRIRTVFMPLFSPGAILLFVPKI